MAESNTGATITTEEAGIPESSRVLQQATIFIGAAAACIGILGFVGLVFNITVLWSIYPGYKTMAFSTAVLMIVLGTMLAANAARPFQGKTRIIALLAVAAFAVGEVVELAFSYLGGHSLIELQMIRIGNVIAGQPTTAISPGTSFFIILWIIGFFLLLGIPVTSGLKSRSQNVVSIIGMALAMMSLTFLLSYVFGEPFLYGTRMIPIAAPTTLALIFLGAGLVTAAGPESFPARYFIGASPGARLLRTFLPLTVTAVIAESIISYLASGFPGAAETILVSTSLVVFSLLTGYIVFRVSRELGRVLETEEGRRKAAEDRLARNNENLTAVNEELLVRGEELRGNLDTLTQKERELQESEGKYRSLFENLLEGYAYCRMIYDEYGRPEDFLYLEVNRAFDQITGARTVTGKRVTEVFPGIKEAFPELFEIYGRVAINGTPETFDLDFRPSGKWLHISVYSPSKQYFVAIFEDITERKKSEEIQALLASIVTQSEDAIYTETLEGIIISWNAGAEKMFGYTPDEALGKSVTLLAPAEFVDDIESVLSKVRAGEPVVNHETMRVRKNGEKFTVSLSISPIKNPKGDIIHASTIVRNITEQKRAQTMLEQINRKLSLLNTITHHDAGNKITALRSYLYLLREDTDNSKSREDIDKIDSIVKDLDDVIEFTRAYQNLGMKNPEWQDVTDLISKLPAGTIPIRTDMDGLKILADPLLGNVFYNLLDNAIRHGERVTAISVTAKETGTGLVLSWEDNGAGVPADVKDRIFERGFGKNTGLGLFLIREILSISGITIRENGTPGEGARFEMTVPKDAYRFIHT